MKIVLWECLVGLVPVTVLTIVTLGAILAGITTAAEAAAFGALGAIFLVIAYGRFSWKALLDACYATLATTSMVLLLAVASNVFGAVFAWLGTAYGLVRAGGAWDRIPQPPRLGARSRHAARTQPARLWCGSC